METKSTTDVFMSIPAEDGLEIARGRKTSVCRSYSLPPTVRRIWLYTIAPLQVIELSRAVYSKLPRESTAGRLKISWIAVVSIDSIR
ncbi:hypothetical protein N7472_005759 [Penicillium cf. griseofulvum]|uniref:Uncharacterized protein n=1 Tax=Penicillium cf. griseofulvum TaxID=2972120 RepID=A0A9W9JP75_9EURO|nr:hypothetical protein N7472_005759 [Penicillium cf. griseofulvum]KAJ5431309.1 hypothetical protein N7445_009041 [Penicillium cf. griseofulvum]